MKVRVRVLYRPSEQTDASVNTLSVSQYTDYTQITTPSSPPPGKGRVFLDSTDGVLKIKKPDGSIVSLEGDEKVKVSLDGIPVATLARKLDFRNAGDIAFTITEDTTDDQFDVSASVKDGVITDAHIASDANIAKSKISPTGTWAKTDLPASVAYRDEANTFTQTNDFQATLRVPRKVEPAVPIEGEIWIDGKSLKYRDNQATPRTQTVEIQENKGQANGYASLDANGFVPTAQLGTGTPTATNALLGNRTWGNPAPAAHTHGKTDLPTQIAYEDEPNTFTQTNDFQATLQVPRKTDPVTPAVGEVWINGAELKYRDNQATPQTQVVELQSNKGQPNGYAALDANQKVIQDPANAQVTPAPNKIPQADANGKIVEGWIDRSPYDYGNVTGTVVVDWNNGRIQKMTLAGNVTLQWANVAAGRKLILELIQDATGGRTVTFPTTVKWEGGVAPSLSTGANKIDIIGFWSDGTNEFAQVYGIGY